MRQQQNENDTKHECIQALRSEIDGLRKAHKELESSHTLEIDSLNDEINRLQTELSKVVQVKDELELNHKLEIESLNDKIGRLQSESAKTEQLEEELEKSKQMIDQLSHQKEQCLESAHSVYIDIQRHKTITNLRPRTETILLQQEVVKLQHETERLKLQNESDALRNQIKIKEAETRYQTEKYEAQRGALDKLKLIDISFCILFIVQLLHT